MEIHASAQPSTDAFADRSLEPRDQKRVAELRRRDREVRAHEQAHQAAAGGLARGGPSYEFERGPDGKLYAVSGEVSIDTSEVRGDPRATIRKMQQVRRAALAPASPSAQDRQIAAEAAQKERDARTEAAAESREAADSSSPPGPYDAYVAPASRGSLVDQRL